MLEKDSSFTYGCYGNWIFRSRREKLNPDTILEQNQFQVYNTPSKKPKWLEEKVESMIQNEGICKDFLNKA